MKKTILEARVFVSEYPSAHERTVKDYEIDIECTDNRLYTYNGQTYKLKSGDVIIKTPGAVVSSIGDQKSYILTLDFSQREHSSVYSRNIVGELQPLSDNELITSLPCVFHPRNPHLLFEIYEKLVQTPLLSSREASLLVDEIIYILNADLAHKEYHQEKRTNDVTHKVIDFMEKNLSKKITLDELAKVTNFEKSYFVRFFKKETGTTPFKMLSEMRLERASDLVVSTDMKINDIAESLGYNTLSFFISEYKKRFGLTPAAHRSNVYSSNIDVKKRVN